jgi:hypothetical protein
MAFELRTVLGARGVRLTLRLETGVGATPLGADGAQWEGSRTEVREHAGLGPGVRLLRWPTGSSSAGTASMRCRWRPGRGAVLIASAEAAGGDELRAALPAIDVLLDGLAICPVRAAPRAASGERTRGAQPLRPRIVVPVACW